MFQELGMFSDSIGMFSSDINQLPAPGLNLDFASGTLDPRVTFTRTQSTYGNVTYTGSNGLIQYAGVNLLTYSQDLTQNAYWGPANVTITGNATASPNGTNTASMVSLANGTLTKYVYQSVTSSTQSSLSIYAKANTQLYLQIIATSDNQAYANFDLSNGTVGSFGSKTIASITGVGNGWYRCVASFNSTVTAFTQIRFYGVDSSSASWASSSSGTGNFYLWGAQLEPTSSATTYIPTTTAASGAARFDYNPITLACNGLLIEESRANILTYSQAFNNAIWRGNQYSVTPNATYAPDGTQTAYSFIDTASNSQHYVYQTPALSTSVAYTLSVYAKANQRTCVWLGEQSVATVFDLSSGTVGESTGVTSSSISPAGNGWYKCSITFTPAAGVNYTLIGIALNATLAGTQYAGDGTSGIYIWGAQLEAGAFPTSYIATTTTSITRNADNASMTGANFSNWYNANQGTLVSIAIPYNVSAIRGGFVVSDGTANNTIETAHGSTPRAFINTGGVNQLSQASGSVAANSIVKSAISYQANNANGACNGVAGTAVLSCSIPTVNKAIIGNVYDGSNALNGTISKIIAYTVRLPDNTLKGLTS